MLFKHRSNSCLFIATLYLLLSSFYLPDNNKIMPRYSTNKSQRTIKALWTRFMFPFIPIFIIQNSPYFNNSKCPQKCAMKYAYSKLVTNESKEHSGAPLPRPMGHSQLCIILQQIRSDWITCQSQLSLVLDIKLTLDNLAKCFGISEKRKRNFPTPALKTQVRPNNNINCGQNKWTKCSTIN